MARSDDRGHAIRRRAGSPMNAYGEQPQRSCDLCGSTEGLAGNPQDGILCAACRGYGKDDDGGF